MGIVDSVGCMETYAREMPSVSVQNGYENTLVGTSRVEKGALNRQKMAEELKKVSGVGYYGNSRRSGTTRCQSRTMTPSFGLWKRKPQAAI